MTTNSRSTLDNLIQGISELKEKAGTKMVFGDPVHAEGRTIIPVAKVRYAFGVGMGRGGPGGQESVGEGGGGGGGLTARPVALIEISGDDVKVKPIPDVTRLALMGMALVAWNIFWITATVRSIARRRASTAA
jgi:uncharacterized spore protein YtfJ